MCFLFSSRFLLEGTHEGQRKEGMKQQQHLFVPERRRMDKEQQ